MAKVYAVFDDDDALAAVTSQFDYKDYEIITAQEPLDGDADSGDRSEPSRESLAEVPVAPVIAGGGLSGSGPVAAVAPLAADADANATSYNNWDTRLDDIPEGERRSFQNALREGGQILVVKRGDANTVQMLKDAGASSVSSW